MTYVDGKKIKDEIRETLKEGFLNLQQKKTLGIIYVGTHPVIDSFVALKESFGKSIGVDVVVHRFKEGIEEDLLLNALNNIQKESDGVVVQLPLPTHLDQESILSLIDSKKDIDLLSKKAFTKFLHNETHMMPPVVGAINEIFKRYSVDLKNKNIVVLGQGKLVGKPVFLWLMREGIFAKMVGKDDDMEGVVSDADVIISGVGVPHILRPHMIKEGVVLIDVGTSESGGTIKGDIDPLCVEKASLFSGVPGGVGPITIATLFHNLYSICQK